MAKETKKDLVQQILLASRAEHNQVDVFDDAACERLGVNRTDLRCLDILGQRGSLTAGGLAEAARLTTGAVTAVADRLERIGYVRRVADPSDRRRIVLAATDKIHGLSWAIWGPLAADVSALLLTYTVDELRLILDFLTRGGAVQEEHLARIRGDAVQ